MKQKLFTGSKFADKLNDIHFYEVQRCMHTENIKNN